MIKYSHSRGRSRSEGGFAVRSKLRRKRSERECKGIGRAEWGRNRSVSGYKAQKKYFSGVAAM